MFELAHRLRRPKPHESDDHNFKKGKYKPMTRIITDGFEPYIEAVDFAFGPHAEYAQLIKRHPNRNTLILEKRLFQGKVPDKDITTSLVERHNFTMRTFMHRLVRKTGGYSKKLENLKAATAMYMACYNYTWRIETFKTSPAVKAGITDHRWSFKELYDHLRQNWAECFLDGREE